MLNKYVTADIINLSSLLNVNPPSPIPEKIVIKVGSFWTNSHTIYAGLTQTQYWIIYVHNVNMDTPEMYQYCVLFIVLKLHAPQMLLEMHDYGT